MNYSIFILILYFVSVVYGYSQGSPQSICLVPYPHHDTSYSSTIPQSNDNLPFNVTVIPQTYQENSLITVIIEFPRKFSYKGILLSIKPNTEDIINPIGKFIGCDSLDIKFFNFTSEVNSCLTHRSSSLKPKTMECIYEAPSKNMGSLLLSAVFVKSFNVFWINVNRKITYVGQKPQTDIPNLTNPLNQTERVTIDGCGKTKNCLLYPLSCYGKSNCQYMVSYKVDGNNVDFELVGPDNGYLSIGLSNDTIMKDDLVIVCANNPNSGIPSLQTAFTTSGKKKHIRTTVDPNIVNKRAGKINFLNLENALVCKFRLPKFQINPVRKSIPRNLSEPLYIFFANGNTYHSTVYVKKHSEPPLLSSSSIILYSIENEIHYFRNLEYYKQVHGTFMILGFTICQPIAIIIIMHFRPNLSYQIKGRQLWFNMHVILNLLFLLLSLVGYIYILCYKQFKFQNAKLHGSFGTIAMALTLINIVMGFLRPDLSSDKRLLFNWSHFINGMAIKVSGYITFWLVFTTINLRNNLKLWTEVVIILWTTGDLIVGGTFWFLRYKAAHSTNEKPCNPAFKYHASNWGLLAYVIFLCIMSILLICGLWIV